MSHGYSNMHRVSKQLGVELPLDQQNRRPVMPACISVALKSFERQSKPMSVEQDQISYRAGIERHRVSMLRARNMMTA